MDFQGRLGELPKSLVEFLASARSDELPWLRNTLAPIVKQCAVLGVDIELCVVVDSSQLIADVRWLAKAKNPSARTALQEAAAAGIVTLFVPPAVHNEVSRRIDELEDSLSFDGARARRAWLQYRKLLTFVESPPATGRAADVLRKRDPSDLPFIGTFQAIGAAGIVTRDPDLLENPVATFGSRIEIDLRDYSRSKAVQLNIVFFGLLSVNVSARAIAGALRLLARSMHLISRLPNWVKLIALVGCAFALANKDRRKATGSFLIKLKEGLACLIEPIEKQLSDVWELAMAESAVAGTAAAGVAAKTPQLPKLKLSQAVNRVFATASEPLSLEHIEKRVRKAGYLSSAKNLKPSIKRYLQSDRRFTRGSLGWIETVVPRSPR